MIAPPQTRFFRLGRREHLECLSCGSTKVAIVTNFCAVEDCYKQQFCKDLCKAHYQRAYRLLMKEAERTEEFWKQVDRFYEDRRR